jgi:hypothetical protein
MKLTFKSLLILFLLFSLSVFLTSCFENCHFCACSDSGKTYYKYEQVAVNRASFSRDTVNSTDTLKISFWGTIGNDSCNSFGYFQATSTAHQTDIVLYGAYKQIWCGTPVCPSGNVDLGGVAYNVFPLTQGNYSVVIHQPDGSTFTKYAFVR